MAKKPASKKRVNKPKEIRAPEFSPGSTKSRKANPLAEVSFEIYFLRDLLAKNAIDIGLVQKLLKVNGYRIDTKTLERVLVKEAGKNQLSKSDVAKGLGHALKSAAMSIHQDN